MNSFCSVIIFLFALNVSALDKEQVWGILLIAKGKVNNSTYKIYSHRPEFEKYWRQSKGQDLETHINNFNINLASPYDVFYNDYSFGRDMFENWKSRKEKILESFVTSYNKNYSEIVEMLKYLEKNIEPIVVESLKAFNFYDEMIIVLSPAFTSGGTVREVTKNSSVVPLGANLLFNSSEPLRIVPHELTHRFHLKNSSFPSTKEVRKWISDGKMFWSLWTEGLATYGTYEITGKTDLVFLMGYDSYKNYDFYNLSEEDTFLAEEFLKVHDDVLVDFNDMEKNKKWFGVDSTSLRKDLPPAIGYYLGFRVIQQLIAQKEYTFSDLIKKSASELQMIGKKKLLEMARAK